MAPQKIETTIFIFDFSLPSLPTFWLTGYVFTSYPSIGALGIELYIVLLFLSHVFTEHRQWTQTTREAAYKKIMV